MNLYVSAANETPSAANYKLQTPLYGYIKNVILSAFLNKTPNLSSFYNFSIDKRPVKGYHVFNTKTKMQ